MALRVSLISILLSFYNCGSQYTSVSRMTTYGLLGRGLMHGKVREFFSSPPRSDRL